ncbi:sugar phosphate nucleotidyltransferase [Candidatus Latescibacterota bacterium]
MKAIIPMAGSGTRLRPLTHSKPKALLPVGSKTIVSHIIDTLLSIGCTRLVLIISHDGAAIPRYILEHYPDIEIETVIQEERLGLGHAVSLARGCAAGEEIIVMYGDTIIEGDISGIVTRDLDGVISVKEVVDPRRFGVVEVESGIITKFVEKPSVPRSNLAIVGFNYFKNGDTLFECLDEIIKDNIKTKDEFQITDAFQLMVERGLKLKPLAIESWFDCGTPQTLLETNRHMLSREGNCESLSGSIVIPPVFIHEGADIVNSIIGPNVSIGIDTSVEKSIVSDSIIGSGARVANATIISSLIGDNAQYTEHPRVLALGDDSSLDFDVT